MRTPLSLTLQHLDSSPALTARVRELAERLERFHDRIISCEVVITAPRASQRSSGAFAVQVEVMIPGGVINANSGYAAPAGHTDVYVAVRDAFDNVVQQLQADVRPH